VLANTLPFYTMANFGGVEAHSLQLFHHLGLHCAGQHLSCSSSICLKLDNTFFFLFLKHWFSNRPIGIYLALGGCPRSIKDVRS